MGDIVALPVKASKFGYKRVKKRGSAAEHPDQLSLFPPPTAQILAFAPLAGRFEQALLLDEREDRTAAEWYEMAIKEQDCVADAYCNLGIIESKQGNTTRAFDCFTASLKQNPRHSEAHYNLGNLYFDLNDYRLAQVHFELAAELDPMFPNVYFNLALAQAINNNLSAAMNALTRYQEMVPKEDGRIADELLNNLKKSLAAAKNSNATSGISNPRGHHKPSSRSPTRTAPGHILLTPPAS
jgi:tetratricopeptide (TPR) repeat protein